ncbi:MAG: hypothetical protein KDC80_11740 [Saprospiraceae bacterium]|nr:hypothetical protein [Saprospiraceae bacterium]
MKLALVFSALAVDSDYLASEDLDSVWISSNTILLFTPARLGLSGGDFSSISPKMPKANVRPSTKVFDLSLPLACEGLCLGLLTKNRNEQDYGRSQNQKIK